MTDGERTGKDGWREPTRGVKVARGQGRATMEEETRAKGEGDKIKYMMKSILHILSVSNNILGHLFLSKFFLYFLLKYIFCCIILQLIFQ